MPESPRRSLSWPDGLDEAAFLSRYWQREPLLLRQALPAFESPLSPDELAGLALEPDTAPRLIRRETSGSRPVDLGVDDTDPSGRGPAGSGPEASTPTDRYTLEHGPFDEDVFATLGPGDWSLLVTDVEKHLPELADWIAAFRLAPDWRFDDLMISYAPDGASVGAHVDEYDVFLLQASGTRRWSIARAPDGDRGDGRHDSPGGSAFAPLREHRTVAGGELSLLAAFEPTDTWELVPGDVLYLPPGVPHHGVAVGEDCTTWSIGFRSPSARDVVMHVAELVAERLPHARLRDVGGGRGDPGRIEASAVAAIGALWESAARLDETELLEITGRLLTRVDAAAPRGEEPFGASPSSEAAAGRPSASSGGATGTRHALPRYRPAPFARLAWSIGADGEARLFADGECLRCSPAFAGRVCDPDGQPMRAPAGAADPDAESSSTDAGAFATLVERGVLVMDDEGATY